jgi:hypothetical protein
LDELEGYLDRLLVVGNINMIVFPYDDGHARGAMGSLTAIGPVEPGQGADSEASGESLDHRIGAELNTDGRDSLFLYAGENDGFLGGASISYRGPGQRRAPLHNPVVAYQSIMGIEDGQFDLLAKQQKSVNDLVRGQMQALMSSSKLSSVDRQRLELHFDAIRDLENTLSCNLTADQQAELEGRAAGYESDDGDEVWGAIRAHIDVAALAVACGYTRSVAIQVGNGNDGRTRYRDPDTGELMENFHYVSHRRESDGGSGSIIEGSDVMHHKVDRQFAQTFKYLLDRVTAYDAGSPTKMLDRGLCVWYNDLGYGSTHLSDNIPYILAGNAGGFFKQGEYVQASGGNYEYNHNRIINTIGSAIGLRNANGDLLDDFGDPELPKGVLPELMA